jgi:dienelactone hydrolase
MRKRLPSGEERTALWEPDDYLRRLTGQTESRFAFKPGRDWRDWRSGLSERLAERLGGLPEQREELNAVVLERAELEGYVRERVEISTFDGLRMPMYVLIPERAESAGPAIVAIHGHGYGSREIAGLEPDGFERAGETGLHKDFAVELVKRGFVVAAPELLGFGDRRFAEDKAAGPKASSCFRLSAHLLMLGRTIAGVRICETMRAVDYMLSRRDVSPRRIGCMGISGGGLVAAFASALDERIQAAVVSGYANTFEDSILTRGHCLDNYIPGILLEAEMPELIGLIAPRALLIESGDADRVFPRQGAETAYERLACIYEAAGASGRLASDFFRGGHEISGARAYEWLQHELRQDVTKGAAQ